WFVVSVKGRNRQQTADLKAEDLMACIIHEQRPGDCHSERREESCFAISPGGACSNLTWYFCDTRSFAGAHDDVIAECRQNTRMLNNPG
ncbi:MAG: hypothetical protein Q7T82_00955, partial [Armatimonadota bacterium]|nr:hypothetical protein [Armatimonadota bacterium]